MNKSEAKNYLLDVIRMRKKIQKKKDRAEDLIDRAADPGAIRYDDIKVQSSGEHDKTARLIAEAVDLRNEIIDEELQLMQMIDERINWILKLDKPLRIDLLCDKYIWGMSIEEIREKLLRSDAEQYRYDYLCREHGNALAALAEIITRHEGESQ